MTNTDPLKLSAQIGEVFTEVETDVHVLDLLNRIAKAIRDRTIDD